MGKDTGTKEKGVLENEEEIESTSEPADGEDVAAGTIVEGQQAESGELDEENPELREDAGDEDANEDEDEDGDVSADEPAPQEKSRMLLINHKYDGTLFFSLLAALIGALFGIIPIALVTHYTGIDRFYPLYIVAPLLAYLINSLLKGGRDIRALITIFVFSVAGAYVSVISSQAALYTTSHGMSPAQIPRLTIFALGQAGAFPSKASAYIYPLVFIIFGVAVIWDFFLRDTSKTENVKKVQGAQSEDAQADDAGAAPDAEGEGPEAEASGQDGEASAADPAIDERD